MIQTQIVGRKFEVDAELQKYIERKLGKLDKYFPRTGQPVGMRIEILRDERADPDKRYHLSVKVDVPGNDILAETATMNPHSAVDIVEVKLKDQIRKYKEKAAPKRLSMKRVLPRASEVTED